MEESQFSLNRELLKASKENNLELIDSLLKKGSNPCVYDAEPVRNAIENNSIEAIDLFLKNGFKPTSEFSICFKKAIQLNNVEIFEKFLSIEQPSPAILATAKNASDEMKIIVDAIFETNF